MELFKNKPMAALAAVFVLSSVLTSALTPELKLALISMVFVLTLAFYAVRHSFRGKVGEYLKKKTVFLTLCAVISAIAILNLYFRVDFKIISAEELIGKGAAITARVTDTVYETVYSGCYIIDVKEIDGEKYDIKIKLETENSVSPKTGDLIKAEADIVPLTKDGGFDEEAYYRPRGVLLGAEATSVEITGHENDLTSAVGTLRNKLTAMSEISAESSDGDFGMAAALLFGDRDGLDKSVMRDFTYTGASHLLAVSGAHFTILLGAVEKLLKKLTLHKTPKTLIMIALTVFYMLLTGLSASVLRAGVMLVIYYLSHFARREADGVTSLFTAVALIFLVSPSSSLDVGLLLSFAAMLSCIFASEIGVPQKLSDKLSRIASKNTASKWLAAAVGRFYKDAVTGLSAVLATLPILWIYFGRVSLFSPISTFVLNIPVTAILYLSPLVILTFKLPWLSALFAYPCSFFCRLSVSLVRLLSETNGAQLSLPTETVITAVFCTVLVVCITIVLAAGKRIAKIAGTLVIASFFTLLCGVTVYTDHYDGNSLEYVSVGKNEAFAVTDGVRALVCDISNGGRSVTSAAVEAAKENLAQRVDVYMLTHLHTRHKKTVSYYISREYIDCIMLPEPIHEFEGETEVYLYIKDLAEKNGISVKTYERGTEIMFGDIKIDTATAKIDRSTQPVISLSFDLGDERITYIGSSVHESDIFDLTRDMCQSSDTVIFGIHGPVMKSGADYGLLKTAKVIYSTPEAAEFNIDMNRTEIWNVYGN